MRYYLFFSTCCFSFLLSSASLINDGDSLKNNSSKGLKSKFNKSDTLSKFYRINKRFEKVFKYMPIPMYAYSFEAGHTLGLAKFNLFDMFRDSITRPSRISGVFSVSTKGRVNFSLSTELILKKNKVIFLSYINYRKTPEFILGIGNDVKLKDLESISVDRFKYYGYALFRVTDHLNIGGGIDVSQYYNIKLDTNSILIRQQAVGIAGGFILAPGVGLAYDTRDNRYNPSTGFYALFSAAISDKSFGSAYNFTKVNIDVRKYYNPWYKHKIALQATSTYSDKDVPFYELAMLGGDAQMRGYYKGALRDKVLLDGQVEYRMPIWKIFGIAAWAGAGQVAPSYDKLSTNRVWFSYGVGIRVRVDSKHNTNLRIDYGRGLGNVIQAFNIGFAEAF